MSEDDPAAGASPAPKPRARYYTLGVLSFVFLLNFVDRQVLAVLQEPIRLEMGLSDQQLGLLTGTAFAFFYISAGIPIARWADIGNRRNIVSLAVGIWSLMTALQSFVGNYAELIAARVGVGVGEAGGSPPSYSMLSDLFAPEERGRAFAIYSIGGTSGLFLSYLFGSWLSDSFGWRSVFLALGLPGVAMAVLVRLSVREPTRGYYDRGRAQAAPPVLEVLRFLWSRRSFRHIALGGALHAFVSYAVAAFVVSFYVRSFAIGADNLTRVAVPLGITVGIAGAIGNLSGGSLADLLGKRDPRWYLWVCGTSTLLAIPAAFACFLAEELDTAIALYFLPIALGYMHGGPTLAMAHGIVSPRMRALTTSILFFMLNLVGLGLGPWTLGRISDALAPAYGEESLRYAILSVFGVYVWSAFHYFWGARYLRDDLRRAPA